LILAIKLCDQPYHLATDTAPGRNFSYHQATIHGTAVQVPETEIQIVASGGRRIGDSVPLLITVL